MPNLPNTHTISPTIECSLDLDRAEILADTAIREQNLESFIQSWNDGDPDGTLITSLQALRLAVYVAEAPCAAFDRALDAAVEENVGVAYLHALANRLDFSITSTSIAAMLRQASEWASDIVDSSPLEHRLMARFETDDEFVAWALSSIPQPPFCCPDGSAIITGETEATLLDWALRATLSASGWSRWIE